jgi:hypothetical protein
MSVFRTQSNRKHGRQLQLCLTFALSALLPACAMSTEATPDAPSSAHIEAPLAGDAATDTGAQCSSITLETAADVRAARACRVIDGDLRVRGLELEAIGEDDLPNLERVTGSLISEGGKNLRELSLPNLREVGSEDGMDSLQIGLDGSHLRRVALPRLQTVHGGIGVFGLYALEELDLRALDQVDGALVFATMPRLREARLSPDLHVDGGAQLQLLCALPFTSIALPEGSKVQDVGCCTESSSACDGLQCACGDDGGTAD